MMFIQTSLKFKNSLRKIQGSNSIRRELIAHLNFFRKHTSFSFSLLLNEALNCSHHSYCLALFMICFYDETAHP